MPELANSKFKSKIQHLNCEKGKTIVFEFPFVEGFDFTQIDHLEADCSCTGTEIHREKVFGKYTNNGNSNALVSFEEKTIYVIYKNWPTEEITPLRVKNDNGVDVINWNGRDWEVLSLKIKVTSNG